MDNLHCNVDNRKSHANNSNLNAVDTDNFITDKNEDKSDLYLHVFGRESKLTYRDLQFWCTIF